MNGPPRGTSSASFREVTCKDCLREMETGHRPIPDEERGEESPLQFEYSEAWATRMLARGGNRTDRCLYHRKLHRQTIKGLAVPYVDLQTIGEVADRENPTGPLGGLGQLPAAHVPKEIEVDLAPRKFGMTDDDVREMLGHLSEKRVLILKAGTGTGKSTFGPFRLMSPPADAAMRLTDFGPIVVTEPRVQATIGVATFVGEKLVADCSIVGCSDHVGPGYPVGYQVKGDKKHDESCQLVYVTDGTMVSWLGQGRLSKIGTVIIDEAHERSTNIDFILGYLKRELDRYPHLRVIVTSATFDVNFYVDYFGGEGRVASMDVPAVKSFGYGAPLFPLDGDTLPCHCDPNADDYHGPIEDFDAWLAAHWVNQHGPELDGRPAEDLWETTGRIHPLRSTEVIPEDPKRWRKEIAGVLARQVIKLIKGLDAEGKHTKRIDGDILTFLPSEKMINEAVADIREEIPREQADIYPLLASMTVDEKEKALAGREPGARRRVLVASNIAETSLTIEGIRFVVDSGLITQEEWDPIAASRTVPTKPHSRAGVRQRWGRVGRDAPGWVFPLYSRKQFDGLATDTAPGSTRANLEQLIMTAKVGGIDDVEAFPWPVAHPYDGLDASALEAVEIFAKEGKRASSVLAINGSLDAAGDATRLGKEMQRFTAEASPDFGMAVMFADQLACVPETVTAMYLLEGTQLAGAVSAKNPRLLRQDPGDPLEWRLQARACHAALYGSCRDDLDFAIRVMAAWERADPELPPWTPSARRRAWADRWWIDDACLVAVAEKRRATLEELSPAMREQVKRFLDVRLVPRTRAILSRVLAGMQYVAESEGTYRAVHGEDEDPPASIHPGVPLVTIPDRVIALKRDSQGGGIRLQNLVAVEEWACEPAADGSPPDAFELLARCAERCTPRRLAEADFDPLLPYLQAWPVGARFRCELDHRDDAGTQVTQVSSTIPPFGYPRDPDEPLAEPAPLDGHETRWPGNRHPEEDDEALAAQLVLDPSDDEHDRERGLEANDYADTRNLVSTGDVVDVLDEWEESAAGVSRPAAIVRETSGNPYWQADDWYEVAGYEIGEDGEVMVVLEPAQLPPEVSGDPASHPDLAPGSEIEVAVGEAIEEGEIKYRPFWRTDGKGRFLLAKSRKGSQATGAPVSLNDENGDLLERLDGGTVLAAEVTLDQAGTRSITVVPFLAGQLDRAADEGRFLPAIAVTELDGKSGQGGERRSARWGEVELQVAHPDGFLLHAFGVYPGVRGLEGEAFEAGVPLLVQLGLRQEKDRASLAHRGHEDQLAQLAAEHPETLLFETSGPDGSGARRFTYAWSLSTEIRDALLGLDDNLDWQHAVWVFYVRSHERVVTRLRSGTASEPITAALVRTRSAPPVRMSGAVPKHWEYMFDLPTRFGRERQALSEACGARVHSTPPREIHVQWDDRRAVEVGVATLKRLLAQPVVAITVPSQAQGAVIGSGGANIKRLEALDGVFSCSLSGDPPQLRVVARDSAALRAVIDSVVAMVGIRMTVPEERLNGRLIGKKGVTVKEMREASGCHQAENERGTVNWTLRAPSRAAIEEFVRLANERVPGCQLGPPVVPLTIRDCVRDADVDDWVDYEFAPADIPDDWIDVLPNPGTK